MAGIFLPTSPTAANQSDAGMVTLPLADMLSSSQPGPPATSIMNSVAGQLNALLSASMPVPQAAQLSSLSPGPMAVPPTSTLASSLGLASTGHVTTTMAGPPSGTLTTSLGLPSTGPLTPSGPMAVPPMGTLTTSLSLPSTGPLTPSGPITVPPMGTMTTSFGLPSSGPMTPSGPMAMPTAGTLTTSLGLPSSGPLTPNSPMVVPPMGTLTTSLSLPSSGPLAPSSPPTAAPPAGTVTTSFGLTSSNPLTPSSPLLASTMAPVAVPQSLLASPLGNTVTSESTRVRLSETMRRCSSGSQATGTHGKENMRSSQDSAEPLSVTFVGPPLLSSTPTSPAAFYGASNVRTQPSAPQGQVVVCTGSIVSCASSSAPDPRDSIPNPQAAASNGASPSETNVAHGATRSPSRPRAPSHSPTRMSSLPASVNDARGARASETSRKSVLELERKLAHRKVSKFQESPRESRQMAWERLVGEIAFQLDRRILSSIFPERVRLYGFTVSNIPEKIIQASMSPSDHKLDEELCQTLTQRYVSIMNRLQSLGYNGRVHPALTEQLVNAYGILRERPELAASEGGCYTVDFLQHVLVETVHPGLLTDALLLLSCLSQLALDDGKPMFIW
ncbi:speriolin isoform X1 [Echinops telfairi]|uniref:Speriolin isoform X1 n=1 Tax=Echinops telfairi TaxID=9371 RepID=A0AC55CWQ6_ECHTE|nr:speriolin isoform X1 [Echinops telfairi]